MLPYSLEYPYKLWTLHTRWLSTPTLVPESSFEKAKAEICKIYHLAIENFERMRCPASRQRRRGLKPGLQGVPIGGLEEALESGDVLVPMLGLN